MNSAIKEKAIKMCESDKLMKKSILKEGIEKEYLLLNPVESLRQKKKAKRIEREKTKGSRWFNLPKGEMTEEVKDDLSILQMRSTLDPKHFYKSNDLKVLPKYFQVGTVLDSPLDRYQSIPKRQRKRTLVEELLADAEFKRYNKIKYSEIQQSQMRKRKGSKTQGVYIIMNKTKVASWMRRRHPYK
ncbi:hypothetical protein CHUAL_009226 [Chamberlinius hualienensis]